MSEGCINPNNSNTRPFTHLAYAPVNNNTASQNIARRSNRLYPWHNMVGNFLFIDGHAKGWNVEHLRNLTNANGDWTDGTLEDLRRMSMGHASLQGYLTP